MPIYDLYGRVVAQVWLSAGDNRLDLSFLPTGVYILMDKKIVENSNGRF